MNKSFRKIPKYILEKINELNSNELIVGTVLQIKKSDIVSGKYNHMGICLEDGNLTFEENIIPLLERGRYSKKNILGYKIRHTNQDKVDKTYYAGERPIFGDWSKGSFSLFITKKVFPIDIYPPMELSMTLELLDEKIVNNEKNYTFKFLVNNTIKRNSRNFSDNVLFNMNILQENVLSCNIFSQDASNIAFLDTLDVDWEIFPPGERKKDIKMIIGNTKNISKKRLDEITNRYDFIRELNPAKIIKGKSGLRNYFGAQFSDNLVVFENKDYGNALYIMFENWKDLSKLSRTDLQNRPGDQFIRVPHIDGWEKKAKRIIENNIKNNVK